MLDRVREALFSSLGTRVEEARVLDLFAGTGSLGLEALSRGAESARLVETDRTALACLRTNITTLKLHKRAEVVVGDALDAASWPPGTQYDLVFFDPPYPLLGAPASKLRLLTALRLLLREHLSEGGLLVFHTPRAGFQATEIDGEQGFKLREYGTNALWYLVPLGAATP